MNKQELISNFLALLKANKVDQEKIKRFSDPDWQARVTIKNLEFLIQNEKNAIVSKNELLAMFEPK